MTSQNNNSHHNTNIRLNPKQSMQCFMHSHTHDAHLCYVSGMSVRYGWCKCHHGQTHDFFTTPFCSMSTFCKPLSQHKHTCSSSNNTHGLKTHTRDCPSLTRDGCMWLPFTLNNCWRPRHRTHSSPPRNTPTPCPVATVPAPQSLQQTHTCRPCHEREKQVQKSSAHAEHQAVIATQGASTCGRPARPRLVVHCCCCLQCRGALSQPPGPRSAGAPAPRARCRRPVRTPPTVSAAPRSRARAWRQCPARAWSQTPPGAALQTRCCWHCCCCWHCWWYCC